MHWPAPLLYDAALDTVSLNEVFIGLLRMEPCGNSGKEPARIYRCRKTQIAPKLDGRIDSTAWRRAEPAPLVLADSGGTPVQPTEVRLLYDDHCLYVAFHCVDRNAWGTMRQRDDPICREEVVEVFLDAASRRRAYYEIEVSPLNVVYDLYVIRDRTTGDRQELSQWDCRGLHTAVHIEREATPEGTRDRFWNCEMAIPFHQIHDAPHTPPEPGDIWRMNCYRIDRDGDRVEFSAWSPTGEAAFHRPDHFGELVFLPDES